MALTILTNTYISLADAESYFQTRFGAEDYWDAATNKEKVAALVTAYFNLLYSDMFSLPVVESGINVPIRQAQCEQALFLLMHGQDIDLRLGLQAQGVDSSAVVKETYRGKMNSVPISPIAQRLLIDYHTEVPAYATDLERDDDEDV